MRSRPRGAPGRGERAGRIPWLRWLVVAAGVMAVVAHLWFWYAPRLRLAVPRSGDLPAELLDEARFPVRLWLAYPHQNLGRLGGAVGDPASYLESVARLAGAARPWLPGFGPFDVPPSSELTVAVGESGEGVVAAKMYPLMAAVGRLAGILARNPLLAGGEVVIGGRPAHVRWEGTLWILETGSIQTGSIQTGSIQTGSIQTGSVQTGSAETRVPDAGSSVRASERPPPGAMTPPFPGVAVIALSRIDPPLISGTYVVAPTASGGVLCRRLSEDAVPKPILPRLVSPGTALAVVERGLADSGESEGVRALLLSRPTTDEPGELPGAAAVAAPGDRRFSLPGEGLTSVLDLRLHEREVGGLRIVALDRGTLEAATRLATGLERQRSRGASFELWGSPPALLELAARLGETFGRVPIVGRREVRFWRDVERVLSPFGRFDSLVLVGSESALEVRLERSTQLTAFP